MDHNQYHHVLAYLHALTKIHKIAPDKYRHEGRFGTSVGYQISRHYDNIHDEITSYRTIRRNRPVYQPLKNTLMRARHEANSLMHNVIGTGANIGFEVGGKAAVDGDYRHYQVTLPYGWIKLHKAGMAQVEKYFIVSAEPWTTGNISTYRCKYLEITGRASSEKKVAIQDSWIGVWAGDKTIMALGASKNRAIANVERRIVKAVDKRMG